MKHTRPDRLLARTLLTFVRDERPTTDQFIERFGEQAYHVLRKHGVVAIDDDRLRLSRRRVSADGNWFVWGATWVSLETDEVRTVCYGAGGAPPVFHDED